MITTEPIGDWTWEVTPATAEARPSQAAEIAVAVWNVLARQELAVPVGKAGLSVRATHDARDARLDVRGLALEELREHELLVPKSLEWDWFVHGSGGTGLSTRMSLLGPIDDEEVPLRVARSRPVGFPDAQVGSILAKGAVGCGQGMTR